MSKVDINKLEKEFIENPTIDKAEVLKQYFLNDIEGENKYGSMSNFRIGMYNSVRVGFPADIVASEIKKNPLLFREDYNPSK